MGKHMFGLVIVAGVVLGAAGAAEACSCSSRCKEVLLDSWSSIPANTPGFPLAIDVNRNNSYMMPEWVFTDVNRSAGHEIQVDKVDDIPQPFSFLDGWDGYLVRPTQTIEPGIYALSALNSECGSLDGHTFSIFRVTPEAVIPSSLGVLDLDDSKIIKMQVNTDDGCSGFFDVIASYLRVHLTEEAKPWRDAFFFTTLVDGERWAERSDLCEQPSLGEDSGGRGATQLFSLCGQFNAGLEPGHHTVKVLAWLPGTDLVLETEELEFELDCTALEAHLAELEADRNKVCEESPAVKDEQVNEGDVEPPAGGGASAGEDDEGCNVAAPSGSTSGGWLGLGLAGLGVWVGLRRR